MRFLVPGVVYTGHVILQPIKRQIDTSNWLGILIDTVQNRELSRSYRVFWVAFEPWNRLWGKSPRRRCTNSIVQVLDYAAQASHRKNFL